MPPGQLRGSCAVLGCFTIWKATWVDHIFPSLLSSKADLYESGCPDVKLSLNYDLQVLACVIMTSSPESEERFAVAGNWPGTPAGHQDSSHFAHAPEAPVDWIGSGLVCPRASEKSCIHEVRSVSCCSLDSGSSELWHGTRKLFWTIHGQRWLAQMPSLLLF